MHCSLQCEVPSFPQLSSVKRICLLCFAPSFAQNALAIEPCSSSLISIDPCHFSSSRRGNEKAKHCSIPIFAKTTECHPVQDSLRQTFMLLQEFDILPFLINFLKKIQKLLAFSKKVFSKSVKIDIEKSVNQTRSGVQKIQGRKEPVPDSHFVGSLNVVFGWRNPCTAFGVFLVHPSM
ncbi:hypothetical protein B0J15DRAFT_149293 [Fusarium solani]|uniref:Uncharacterized protein n=1 Tax=Fusarium solani TaxID=169388 RepID=A0A9P9JRK7_FUSSL|nr:uncharacterized protein B0J15DRAFT_149293 [Fusarium solani]KAH7235182.1 hypothetical protein B0J15DRAFT_149293 [Fusarium solani]